MFKQAIAPNLDPVVYQNGVIQYNWVGLCLAYVQTAYGAGWSGPTALISWQGGTFQGVTYQPLTQGGHADKNVPIGVDVPLWYSGWRGYGHVLIAKLRADGSGTAWTSPNDSKASADEIKFSNLDHLTRILKEQWSWDIEYLGWSECVGPTRVIERVKQVELNEEEDMVTMRQLEVLYRFYFGGPVSDYGLKNRLGKQTFEQAQNEILQSPEYKAIIDKAKNGELDLIAHVPELVRVNFRDKHATEEFELVTEKLYRKK